MPARIIPQSQYHNKVCLKLYLNFDQPELRQFGNTPSSKVAASWKSYHLIYKKIRETEQVSQVT